MSWSYPCFGGLASEFINGDDAYNKSSKAWEYGGYAGLATGFTGLLRGSLSLFRTTFIGSPQSTGTVGHALVSRVTGIFHAINNPNVVRVAWDVGYKRALGGIATITGKWGPRPDVLLGFKNAYTRVIEVASKTDKVAKLQSRNANKMAQENLSGEVKVNNWALYLNKVFGK